MGKYKYSAVNTRGEKVAGTLEADSLHGVTTALLDRGLRVAEVTEQKSVLQFEITSRKVKPANVMHFSRQLAAFVRAGVPLMDALEIVREETADKTLRKVVEEVQVSLRNGDSFTAAMSAHTEAFPSFYVSVLSSADVTGRLDHVLDQLSKYIERSRGEAQDQVVAGLPGNHHADVVPHRRRPRWVRAAEVQEVLPFPPREAPASDEAPSILHELHHGVVARCHRRARLPHLARPPCAPNP